MRRFIVFFIALLAVLLPPALCRGAEGIPVREIRVEGLYSIGEDELLYMMCLEGASAIDPVEMQRGIKRAFHKGIFDYISVESDDDVPGLIWVKVREKEVIEDLSFNGYRAVARKFIKRHFPVNKLDYLKEGLMERAAGTLRDALALAGYPEAKVSVGLLKTKKPYRVKLAVQVEEGPPLIVRKVTITGGDEEARGRIKSKISPGAVYDRFRLDKEIEAVKKRYKKEDYLNPRASYSFSEGALSVNLEPGKRYEALFFGNDKLGKSKLRRLLPFSEAGDVRDDLVAEAVERIVSAYHEAGHPFAQVAPVLIAENDTFKVNFYVFEGARVKVGAVDFTGSSLPSQRIKELMGLRPRGLYNPDLLESDRSRIRELYESLGYLDAEVGVAGVKVENGAASIAFDIKEGERYLIRDVRVEGVLLIPAGEVEKAVGIKAGDIYNEVDITDARYRILDLYSEYGYADGTVEVERMVEDSQASIRYVVREGRKLYFGKRVIAGNRQTDVRVIEREMLHEENSLFRQRTLMKERQRLYELGLFRSVSTEVLGRHDSKLDTIYRVSESKPGALEFGLGYGEYERHRGFAAISYRNLFGMDRSGSARLEFSSLETRSILNYNEPWFLGRKLPFRAFLLAEKREERNIDTGRTRYKLTRYTANVGVEKQFSDRVKGELYHEFSLVRTFDIADDVVLSREDRGTLAISALRPAVFYDSRDNPFDPRKGLFAGVSLKAASSAFFSETNFLKLIAQGSSFFDLSKPLVLAVSLRVGVAKGFGRTDELPIVERFFLGGRNSVRGYSQDSLGPKGADGNPVGGNAFVAGNVELRATVRRNWGLVGFLDAGNVWLKLADMDIAGIKHTVGLGLRYKTPVGPLRIDYGHKLARRPGESKGEVHFSIGHAF